MGHRRMLTLSGPAARLSRASNLTPTWVFAILTCLALGGLRFALAQPNTMRDPLIAQHGQSVILEGLIADEPDVREQHVNLRVRPKRLVVSGAETLFQNQPQSLILIRADKTTLWRYGHVVRAFGLIDAPFVSAEFDYRAYLARKGLRTWMPKPDRVESIR